MAKALGIICFLYFKHIAIQLSERSLWWRKEQLHRLAASSPFSLSQVFNISGLT